MNKMHHTYSKTQISKKHHNPFKTILRHSEPGSYSKCEQTVGLCNEFTAVQFLFFILHESTVH